MALIQPIEDGKLINTSKEETTTPNKNDLGYDQFLQLLCAEMQYQDPLEPTSNTEYVAQLATFSQMEAMLNMQNSIQSSQANDLVGKYVIVKTTSPSTGETTAVAGFVDYVQYENGKQYLYINGNRYSMEDVYQVADTEYMEAVSLAEAFKASVFKLPSKDELTLADEETIENLITVFNGFNSYQQSQIDEATLTRFMELAGTMKGLVFDDELSQLPTLEELTLENKEAVEGIRKMYDGLSGYEKKFINKDSYDKFLALEEKMKELVAGAGEEVEGDGDETEATA